MTLFPEEQLDSSVGYFPVQLGQTLEDGRWTITRKLGWGPRSSTWLALDNKKHVGEYEAIKILTVAATQDKTGNNERDLLLGPVTKVEGQGFPKILSSFYEHDSKGKRHLCLVLRVLGPSVEDLRGTNAYDGEYLPLHTVQKVIGDISERLANLADQKIIHGAVTADNFLFWSVQTRDAIRKVLGQSKHERVEKIEGSDGVTYASVRSQPIPHGYTWDATAEDIMHAQIYLSNYAHARQVGSAMNLDYQKNFLSPEALQGGKIDLKSDIWMLGCTTYRLLTGSLLFSDSYIASPIETATETLGKLEGLLTESGKISEKDIASTASFLRLCLAIKPTKRANAVEVLNGGWVKGGCSCGWCS